MKLRRAFAHAAPPGELDTILARCAGEKEGSTVVMMQSKPVNRALRCAAALAAVFALLIGGGVSVRAYQANYAVASTVSLDVNPSIEITVNEKERVLAVTPKNDDAAAVVGEMDFAGSSIEVTVNALIGSMLRGGYLDDMADAILVSVDSSNTKAGQALQEKLTETIRLIMQEAAFEGQLLIRQIEANKALIEMAEQNHITVGKAQMIEAILALNNAYSAEELANWPIGALSTLLNDGLTDTAAAEIAAASSDCFVTADEAKTAALALTALTEDLTENDVCTTVARQGRIVYRISYDDIRFRYYIHVDAVSGEAVLINRELQQYRIENLSEERLTALDIAAEQVGLTRDDVIIRWMYIGNCPNEGVLRYKVAFSNREKTMSYESFVDMVAKTVISCESRPYDEWDLPLRPYKNAYQKDTDFIDQIFGRTD